MWELLAAVLQGVPSQDPYFLALHEAVRGEFPDVECETRTCCGLDFQTNTLFWKAGTNKEPISDYKARLVHSFVRGWKEGRLTAKSHQPYKSMEDSPPIKLATQEDIDSTISFLNGVIRKD